MLVSDGKDLIPEQLGVIAIANNDVDYDEAIQKRFIESVFNDVTVNGNLVVIKVLNGKQREINLAEVSNQAGWTNNEAGTLQAVDDINSCIVSENVSYDGDPTTIIQDSTHRFATDAEKSAWDAKQAELVSATNIKTINGSSVLGSGDLVVSGADATKLAILNDLSDLNNAANARTNIGLNTTANQTDSANKRFVTDAQLTVVGNTSGTNTGDNATNTQYSGLATSKQDVPTGTPDGTKYLRDDNTWQPIAGGSGLSQQEVLKRLSFRI